MTPLCRLCQTPILVARAAVGGEEVLLEDLVEPGPMPVRPRSPYRALVGGFAWEAVDIVAAIALETSVDPTPDAMRRANHELDWHRVHLCTAGLVPA